MKYVILGFFYLSEDTVWSQSIDIENIDPTEKLVQDKPNCAPLHVTKPKTPVLPKENTLNNHFPITKGTVPGRKMSAYGRICIIMKPIYYIVFYQVK
jgi:hypothetical protein